MTPDFVVEDHGSILVLQPLSGEANEWSDENLMLHATMWGGGYVVEPRYIEAIIDGITADGLTVSG